MKKIKIKFKNWLETNSGPPGGISPPKQQPEITAFRTINVPNTYLKSIKKKRKKYYNPSSSSS